MPNPRITVQVIDENGSFKRFLAQAPKLARAHLHDLAIEPTVVQLYGRMRANAPVDPNTPPHMRDALGFKTRGLSGQAGILDDDDQAHVALYNEYNPNQQPFMLPAAEGEAQPLVQRATKALRMLEKALSQ